MKGDKDLKAEALGSFASEKHRRMRDLPDIPNLENRNSEFDLMDIERNLENSWMIIEEAERERRRKNSKELEFELMDADGIFSDGADTKGDGVGVARVGSDGDGEEEVGEEGGTRSERRGRGARSEATKQCEFPGPRSEATSVTDTPLFAACFARRCCFLVEKPVPITVLTPKTRSLEAWAEALLPEQSQEECQRGDNRQRRR